MVYIAEAHAEDEWPISSGRFAVDGRPVRVAQPTTGAERCAAAAQFAQDYGVAWPLCVDPPIQKTAAGAGGGDGVFEREYAPWPLRFYGVHGGVMQYIASPQQCSYDLTEVRSWLLGALTGA